MTYVLLLQNTCVSSIEPNQSGLQQPVSLASCYEDLSSDLCRLQYACAHPKTHIHIHINKQAKT